MAILVTEANAQEACEWNNFVRRSHIGTYCHRYEWKAIIESAYSIPVKMLVARDGGGWVGLLPVVLMPKLLGLAPRAVSVAYCNYGDVVVTPERAQDIELVRRAFLEFLGLHRIAHVEVREWTAQVAEAQEVTLMRSLPPGVDELWRQVGDKVRNQIRKARKCGLNACWGRDQVEHLYAVYASNVGRLGTPVHAKAFFDAILRELGEDSDILTVRLNGKVIAAMLLVKHGNVWADPFAGSLQGYLNANPNMFMYWEALSAACQQGIKTFDLGRSQLGSGTDRFKRQWGAQPYPLLYRTYIRGVTSGSSSAQLYRGGAGQLIKRVWRGLPLPMQLAMGPALRRWIP